MRVYLGAAPGVGKTFAMLDEGRRRVSRGTDVIVGYVETHGRERTEQQIGGLEVIPRERITYRGSSYEEMDLGQILARDPDVVLVDELAHSNVPGVKHEKRWQDVEDLLAAGITVITTVNIQHLESLNDVVESITGIRQRETVPDKVVRQADAIELVDMSPQALRRRMAHGNVYAQDKVDAALSQYFREGNLTALRELALLWLADHVDDGLDHYREQHGIDSTWAARERVVVAVTGGPESEVLLRRAARIASRTAGGEWMVVYVTRGDGLVQMNPDRLHDLHRMAEDLGGTFHTVVGDNTAGAILQFARAENATQVVIGASRRGRLSTITNPGVGEVVIAESGDVDVHIVAHEEVGRTTRLRRASSVLSRRRRLAGYALAFGGPAILTGLLWSTSQAHGLPTEAMLFMVLVVASALIGGFMPAIVTSVVGGLALNYFFAPPIGSLTIADPENAFALVLFVVVAIAVSSVVDLAARRTAQAERATAEADVLTVLSHSLLHAGDDLSALLRNACELFGMQGAAVFAPGDEIMVAHGAPIASLADADVSVKIDEEAHLALTGGSLPADDQRLLNVYAVHAAVLRERRAAAIESQERRVLAESDRTRTALLAAVSHDLRSPLAAVKLAVGSLRNTNIVWTPEDERSFLETIDESADRLDDLVANLLDMSRLQMGAVSARIDEVDLEGTIARAIKSLAGGNRVHVSVSRDAPVVIADAGFLERVLANLVGNALSYTPDEADIRVDVSVVDGRCLIRVIDTGPGVPEGAREGLFRPFQRFGDVPSGEGIGLGLAVARGLTESMGGTLTVDDTPGGGLTFVVDLPAAPMPSGEEDVE